MYSTPMFAPLLILFGLLLLCLVSATTAAPFFSYFFAFVPLTLAAGLILISRALPPGETRHLADLLPWPLAFIAILPALLMILQILPWPYGGHPVWASVRAGFPSGVSGHISVDIGATAVALVSYLSVIGMVLFSSALSVNRERAERILFGLTVVAVLISLACLADDLWGTEIIALRDEGLDCACLGIPLTAACGLLLFERYETRHFKRGQSGRDYHYRAYSVLCLAGFGICVGAIAVARSGSLAFAAGSGFLTFVAVAVIRRWALGRLGGIAIGGTAAIMAAALVTISASDPDPRFAFVKKDAASVELTRRILNDTPTFGVGAGGFSALLPIYRSRSIPSYEMRAATTAAKLSIEMGKATLWFAVLGASYAVYWLLSGATSRGRDSFYAAAAGACLIALLNLAFINIGLTGFAIPYLMAAILGLGLAQSKSRSAA